MSHTITFIKSKLIAAGVKNLREFGYPQCNENNILTDEVYSEFFREMLNSKKVTEQILTPLLTNYLINYHNNEKHPNIHHHRAVSGGDTKLLIMATKVTIIGVQQNQPPITDWQLKETVTV